VEIELAIDIPDADFVVFNDRKGREALAGDVDGGSSLLLPASRLPDRSPDRVMTLIPSRWYAVSRFEATVDILATLRCNRKGGEV
jgi:hypothetical protein